MKISTRVRYGLKALGYISESTAQGKLVRIKQISEAENISVQYLEQILYRLKNEGIIEGKRGPNGGYRLLKDPNVVSLYDLYKILDEEERVIDCNENGDHEKSCAGDECECQCIWHKLDKAMTAILESSTLAEYIKDKNII